MKLSYKRLLALLITLLCVICFFSTGALATNTERGTLVTLNAEPDYSLTAPPNITLNSATGTGGVNLGTVSVSDLFLGFNEDGSDEMLNIEYSKTTLVNQSDGTTLEYVISFNPDLPSGTFNESGEWSVIAYISDEAWNAATPGTYVATLTFALETSRELSDSDVMPSASTRITVIKESGGSTTTQPTEPGKPDTPTGDTARPYLALIIFLCSFGAMIVVLVVERRRDKELMDS